jgi:hypothetical protein
VKAVTGARLVVGVEGSHMLHALYAICDGGSVCLMQPPNRFNNVMKDYADCLNLQYGFTIGLQEADGFTIEVEKLKRVLDKL